MLNTAALKPLIAASDALIEFSLFRLIFSKPCIIRITARAEAKHVNLLEHKFVGHVLLVMKKKKNAS